MTRAVVAALVALIVVAPVGLGLVAAQDTGNTTTPGANSTATTPRDTTQTQTTSNWTPPGPYRLDQLKGGGSHDPDAQPSIRLIGDPVRGGLGIRYKPARPFQDEWQWLEPGSTVRTNRLQVKATAFGDATGAYDLVIVYWEKGSQRVQTADGVTKRQYAANQTVQRVTLDLENGYSTQWIELHSVFGETKRVTMWLERDGEPVPGARWQYKHETNPLAQAPASPITSKFDVLKIIFVYALLPGIPGILLGRRAAQHVLDRTVVGTQRGIGFWIGALVAFLTLGVSVAWWQLSVIAAALPAVAGLLIMGVAFIGYLGMYDNQVETAEFNQKDVTSTKSVSGEQSKEARTETILLRDIVRRSGKIWMPAKGIRPMFARYWAKPAEVDESDLKTLNTTDGDVSKKFEIDPGADYVLRHTPAHLEFDPDLTRDLADRELAELQREARAYEDAHPAVATVMSIPLMFKRLLMVVNWRYVTIAAGGFALIYGVVNSSLGLPFVGGALGLLPGLIAGTRAVDGDLAFEEAPYHFSEARAILAEERATYREAKTFEELQQLVADAEMDSFEEIQDFIEAFQKRLQGRWEGMFRGDTPDAGGPTGRSDFGTDIEVSNDD